MFTIEPVTSDQTKIVIEAIFGLGEAIVSGEVNPDLYLLDKERLTIISKKLSQQDRKLVRNLKEGGKNPNVWLEVAPQEQGRQKLADADITKLAWIGRQIEYHYDFPQDVEWAKEELYILQTVR
jgi:pyruvate,water dikinase